jgi:hypothetical protein
MENDEWIPDGFQVVELLREHRQNQQQQGILFDDDETAEAYDKLISEGDREIIPAVMLVCDLFGNVRVLSITKVTELIELDLVPDGSNSVTENEGRDAWEWSSSLADRSIWLDSNYDKLDVVSNSCTECYIEYSYSGKCNC